VCGSAAHALDGLWNVDAAGNWSATTNWLDGNIADGLGATAGITFDISQNRIVTIDGTGRTLGILNIRDANASSSYTIDASGGGLTVKGSGGGSLTLTAANNYTGPTVIDAGATLQIGNGVLTTGSISASAITINGTLIINRPNAFSFTNTTSGAGEVIIYGNGYANAITFYSAGYTGLTTIRSGTHVYASNLNSFGTTAAGTVIEAGATVRMANSAGLNDPVTISGTGVSGYGALYQQSGTSNPFLNGLVTLAADATVRNDYASGLNTMLFNGGLTGAGTLTMTGVGRYSFEAGCVISETSTLGLTMLSTGTVTISSAANTYTGVTRIGTGTLSVAKLADGGATSSIGQSPSDAANLVFGGNSTLQVTGTSTTNRLFTVGDANGRNFTLNSSNNPVKFTNTGALAYGGTGARTFTLTGSNTGANDFAPIIADGTGGATSFVKSGTGLWNLKQTAVNTYTGGTTVTGGTLTAAATTSLGADSAGNNVVVANEGKLTVNAAANIGGNQTFAFSVNPFPTTTSINGALPQLSVGYDAALPTFAASSTAGVIALSTATYTQALDLSTLPASAQASFLGAASATNYTSATLGAGSGDTYRLGGGGSTLTLTDPGAVLTGSGSQLVVGAAGYNGAGLANGTGTVVLKGANDYTGVTLVNPGSTLTLNGASGAIASSSGIRVLGSTLTLDNNTPSATGNNGDRIGNTAGVTLNRATLTMNSNANANSTESVGTLTLTNNAQVTLSTNGSKTTTLTAAGISRTTTATGIIKGGANLGVNAQANNYTQLKLANTAGLTQIGTTTAATSNGVGSATNLTIIPWLMADASANNNGTSFATYDVGFDNVAGSADDIGLRPLRTAETVTFASLAANDENVKDTTLALDTPDGSTTTMNSLVLSPNGNSTLTGGAGSTLTVTSGGLALLPTINQSTTISGFSQINLGEAATSHAEAVIFVTGSGTNTSTLTITSAINPGAAIGLTKAGFGTLTLDTTGQTLTGAITVNAGTLNLRASGAQSSTTINGGTLSVAGTASNSALGDSSAPVNINSGGTLAMDNTNITGAFGGGQINLNDGGTLSLTGGGNSRLVFSNTLVVSGNAYLKQDGAAGSGHKTLIGPVTMSAGSMLTVHRTSSQTNGFGMGVVDLLGDATFNTIANNPDNNHATNIAQITGDGGITKLGTGYLWLANSGYGTGAATTYSGDTRIEQGNLRIGILDALPTTTTLYVNSGATFDLSTGGYENTGTIANYNQTVAGLNDGSAGGGSVIADSVGATGARTLTLGGGGTYSFSGTISNNTSGSAATLALAKTGTGTQTFSGANAYSGGTTISGGTLLVNNTSGSGTGSGAVAVNSPGALGGTGTIAGSVTVNSGGALAPGASAGTLTLSGDLSLDTANLNFELGTIAVSDRINLTGALNAAGTSTFNLTALTGFGVGIYTLLDYGTLGTASLANFALGAPTPGGFTLELADNSSAIILNVTPGAGLPAGNGVWKNGTADGMWTTNTGPNNNWSGAYPSLPGNEAKFDSTVTGTPGTVDLAGNRTVGKIFFDTTSGGYTLGRPSTANTLTMDNSSGTGNAKIEAAGGTHAINAKVFGTAAKTLEVNVTGGSLTLTGGIDNPATATLALSQSGGGTLDAGNVANAGAMTVAGTVAADAISGAGTSTVNGSLTADLILQNTVSIVAGGTVTIRATTAGDLFGTAGTDVSLAGFAPDAARASLGGGSAVPEPGTWVLLAAGAACLLPLLRRQRRAA